MTLYSVKATYAKGTVITEQEADSPEQALELLEVRYPGIEKVKLS